MTKADLKRAFTFLKRLETDNATQLQTLSPEARTALLTAAAAASLAELTERDATGDV